MKPSRWIRVHDLTGQRFGRLTVIARDPCNDRDGKARWLCRCACGEWTVVRGNNLLATPGTRSCGCYKTYTLMEARRHGTKAFVEKLKIAAPAPVFVGADISLALEPLVDDLEAALFRLANQPSARRDPIERLAVRALAALTKLRQQEISHVPTIATARRNRHAQVRARAVDRPPQDRVGRNTQSVKKRQRRLFADA
jgi:hypothetical protein